MIKGFPQSNFSLTILNSTSKNFAHHQLKLDEISYDIKILYFCIICRRKLQTTCGHNIVYRTPLAGRSSTHCPVYIRDTLEYCIINAAYNVLLLKPISIALGNNIITTMSVFD